MDAISVVDPNELRLDPENPRLPEEVIGESQSTILGYLFDNAVLDELATSYVNNGFFEHEPLMVAPHDGHFIVLEGNRRLAALKVLLQDEDAVAAGLRFSIDDELSNETRESLVHIPIFTVANRDEVRKYLGFRHIGGIKTWSAEAKARYIAGEVDRAEDLSEAFREVARRVGSNVQGVRNAYIAITTLHRARDEHGIKIDSVLQNRFGVWTRCMNSPEIRAHLGLGDPRTLEEVRAQLEQLSGEGLAEVIGDLTPQGSSKRPLLADSRDVTVYAQALVNDQAHRALREYGNFELARQIVEEAGLPERLDAMVHALDSMIAEASRASQLPDRMSTLVESLASLASSLKAIVDSKTVVETKT
jgi:hypothetical protein